MARHRHRNGDRCARVTGKWRVDFNGKATSDGEMQFRVTPQKAIPSWSPRRSIRAARQMYIAQDVRDTFKAQLPKERFRAEIVAGERVIVKAHSGEQAFLLELVESSVAGTRIHISPG